MNAARIHTTGHYHRRLGLSLGIALALHLLLLGIPIYRWLGNTPGNAPGDTGGARAAALGELLGVAVNIRPLASPTTQTAPQSAAVEPVAEPVADAIEVQPAAQQQDASADELQVEIVAPSSGASTSQSEQGAGSATGNALLPLGGGGITLEMALAPEVIKWPDPLIQIVVQRKIEDQVIVQVLVDHDGIVRDHRVLRSIPRCPECTASIVEAVLQWRFPPPHWEGEAVQAWVTVPWDFGSDTQR